MRKCLENQCVGVDALQAVAAVGSSGIQFGFAIAFVNNPTLGDSATENTRVTISNLQLKAG